MVGIIKNKEKTWRLKSWKLKKETLGAIITTPITMR